jgi:GntR family transcriptional repressor for pyruvate dehydrogenase complex
MTAPTGMTSLPANDDADGQGRMPTRFQRQSRGTSLAAGATAGQIRDWLLAGDYVPGERLPPERELAQRLGVSRGTVREAIRQLAAIQIVESRHGSGTFVLPLNADVLFAPLEFAVQVDLRLLLHLFEARRVFEPAAAVLATVHASDAELDELAEVFHEYELAYAEGRVDDVARLDARVHEFVAAACRNPILTAILHGLAGMVARSRNITATFPNTVGESRAEVGALVRAMLARDPARAEAAMLRHLSRLEETARQQLPPVGDSFSPVTQPAALTASGSRVHRERRSNAGS